MCNPCPNTAKVVKPKVAESAIKGGAMATARLAMSYDREVMAFPGRPEDKYSAGCNFLIKENIAALTENATDVAHLLGYPIKKTTLQQTILPNFSDDEQGNTLIQLLSENGALHIDELCQLTQRPSSELAAILLQLDTGRENNRSGRQKVFSPVILSLREGPPKY